MPAGWTYVATAEPGDAGMAERIGAHRARRGLDWRTFEAPRDLVGALAAHAVTPLLVDCLTLWLSNALLAGADIAAEIERLDSPLPRAAAPVVLVPNAVGFAIAPYTPL